MKRLSKHKFVMVHLPKSNCTAMGGRHEAIYHFHGSIADLCKDPKCQDCQDEWNFIAELREADDGFRREWQKLSARYARVPQRQRQRAEYRRKRGTTF